MIYDEWVSSGLTTKPKPNQLELGSILLCSVYMPLKACIEGIIRLLVYPELQVTSLQNIGSFHCSSKDKKQSIIKKFRWHRRKWATKLKSGANVEKICTNTCIWRICYSLIVSISDYNLTQAGPAKSEKENIIYSKSTFERPISWEWLMIDCFWGHILKSQARFT